MTCKSLPSIVPTISTFLIPSWQTLWKAFLKSMKLWYRLRWGSRCVVIMTLQLKICSNLICLAPKLASAWVADQPYGHAVMALLGASLLW